MPVTGVSLDEARAFCAWAGGRLPTTVEWQAAAQAGDATNVFPWGRDDDARKRPAAVRRGRTPAPTPSDVLKPYANALGIYDLVGNVWQLTDSEYEDEHTRFVLLRGGSLYTPQAASDFQNCAHPRAQAAHPSPAPRASLPTPRALRCPRPELRCPPSIAAHAPTLRCAGYFGSADDKERPGGAVRLDRHAKYFLMDAAYERAATVGFRCAYNLAAEGGAPAPAAATPGLGAVVIVLSLCLLGGGAAIARREMSKAPPEVEIAPQPDVAAEMEQMELEMDRTEQEHRA